MKKYSIILKTITMSILLFSASCSSNDNDMQKVIDKYCELNTKEHYAAAGAEKEAASAEKKAYEKEVDNKYFKDNKTYQRIMDGMKKCDEALSSRTPDAAAPAGNPDEGLPSAYGDAVSVANNYCSLVDKAIDAAQNGSDSELKKIVAVKVMFEKNMEESYQGNPDRRDSIFKIIEPCMKKEVKARQQ